MAVQSDEWRFRLFDAVASFLRRVTDRLPLVIVLDDLHWADLWHRCKTDLSAVMSGLVSRHPDDRMALLSSLQDDVVRAYFQVSASSFQADLLEMARTGSTPRRRSDISSWRDRATRWWDRLPRSARTP